MRYFLYLIVLLFGMTMCNNDKWSTSRFFQHEDKSEYSISIQKAEACILSKEEAATIIEILSAYRWKESRNIGDDHITSPQEIYYSITITHPDKRKVTLRKNSGDIDDFLIEYPDGTFGKIRCSSDDDTKLIKQWFLSYNAVFNNVKLNENEVIEIKPVFSFSHRFNLELPPVSLNKVQSEQFINLYNQGQHETYESGGDYSIPLPIVDFDPYYFVISYGKDIIAERYPYDLDKFDFKKADRYAIEELISSAIAGHDGEGEQVFEQDRIKISYQYKDGLLDGQIKTYTFDGTLINHIIYEKGLPVTYFINGKVAEPDKITFTLHGAGEKRIGFESTGLFTVNWGDGTIEKKAARIKNGISIHSLRHHYSTSGTYTVTIEASENDCRFISFDCSGNRNNQISSIIVDNCPILWGLDCEYNKLTHLDISGHTALRELECSDNPIINLNVSGCTALERLICRSNDNPSAHIDASNCTALDYVWCENSKFASLNLRGCTALTVLMCFDNQLTHLDITGCKALQRLNCGYNQLKSIALTGCTALEDLSCRNNQLTSLNVRGCTALNSLDCYKNLLTSLNVRGCKALQYLQCTDNKLTSLDLSGCTSLINVDCSDNQLRNLNVRDCVNLSDLRCVNNQLSNLALTGFIALTELSCNENQLRSLDLSGCTALTTLYCTENQLSKLNITGCVALSGLWCYKNQFRLSDLFTISSSIKEHKDVAIGKQNLPPQTVKQGGKIDYSSEVAFGSSPTDFVIEINGIPTIANTDYRMDNGIITFSRTGSYTITMTNSAVKSPSACCPVSVVALVEVVR